MTQSRPGEMFIRFLKLICLLFLQPMIRPAPVRDRPRAHTFCFDPTPTFPFPLHLGYLTGILDRLRWSWPDLKKNTVAMARLLT